MKYLTPRVALVLLLLITAPVFCQVQHHAATGLVLKVETSRRSATISCGEIPGYMPAMTMSFSVPDAKDFAMAAPGTVVDFVVVADKDSVHIESVRKHAYQGLEPDPSAARRLKLLAQATSRPSKPLALGESVPDFTLTAQDGRRVAFSEFHGKVTALNFVYTRCALPNFCVRSTNNFGDLQKRFKTDLRRNLVLLTVTFDPVHDSPEVMAKYARRWNADPEAWHFLTGPEAAIRHVCDLFGEDYFPDEGLMDHSLHTAIIDRGGHLVANIEGNEVTSQQLGDLIEAVLRPR